MVKFVLQYLNKWTLTYLEIPVICNSDPVTLSLILRKHQPTSQGISASQSFFWIVALSQCDLEHQLLDWAVLWGLWGCAYASQLMVRWQHEPCLWQTFSRPTFLLRLVECTPRENIQKILWDTVVCLLSRSFVGGEGRRLLVQVLVVPCLLAHQSEPVGLPRCQEAWHSLGDCESWCHCAAEAEVGATWPCHCLWATRAVLSQMEIAERCDFFVN